MRGAGFWGKWNNKYNRCWSSNIKLITKRDLSILTVGTVTLWPLTLDTADQTASFCFCRFSQTGTQARAGLGFQPVGEVQSFRPEVRMAQIRKTRIQTSGRNANHGDCELTDQINPKSQLDQRRPARVTEVSSTESSSVVSYRYTLAGSVWSGSCSWTTD